MQQAGTIAELWRYPVKGMRGEAVKTLQLDADGVAGDRRLAIASSGAPHGKPLLPGAERAAMLLYRAQVHDGTTQVTTPRGRVFDVGDASLLADMQAHLPGSHVLSLVQSSTPLTDVRPVALLGTPTVAQLARELGGPMDARRFRANVLVTVPEGFAEDALVGRVLHVGDAVLRVTERTPRCRMVTLDPVTAEPDPALMKHLDRMHSGRVGIYAVVVRPGELRVGDPLYAV